MIEQLSCKMSGPQYREFFFLPNTLISWWQRCGFSGASVPSITRWIRATCASTAYAVLPPKSWSSVQVIPACWRTWCSVVRQEVPHW